MIQSASSVGLITAYFNPAASQRGRPIAAVAELPNPGTTAMRSWLTRLFPEHRPFVLSVGEPAKRDAETWDLALKRELKTRSGDSPLCLAGPAVPLLVAGKRQNLVGFAVVHDPINLHASTARLLGRPPHQSNPQARRLLDGAFDTSQIPEDPADRAADEWRTRLDTLLAEHFLLTTEEGIANAVKELASRVGWQLRSAPQFEPHRLKGKRMGSHQLSDARRIHWLDLHLHELAVEQSNGNREAFRARPKRKVQLRLTKRPSSPERKKRATAFDRTARFSTYLSAVAHGATYIVHTEDRRIGRTLFVSGHRGEMDTLDTAVAILRDQGLLESVISGLFVDVGANIGTSTVHALVNHGFVGAIACEPAPENFAMLKMNLVANGLDERATAFQVAGSDSGGSLKLAMSESNWGDHRVIPPDQAEKRYTRRSSIPVPRRTVDHLAVRVARRAKTHVGLLWIDVQGHEGEVLRGAEGVLAAGTPTVFEFYPKLLNELGELDRFTETLKGIGGVLIDLRCSIEEGIESFSASDLSRVSEAYMESRGVTDLLLLPNEKLPPRRRRRGGGSSSKAKR